MSASTSMRLSAMAIVIVSLIGALTARLWFLTAVEGEAAVQAADANRIRTLHIQAPRGRIFDRNYSILVDNEQVRELRIDSEALNEAVGFEEEGREEVFARVADALTRYQVPHEDEVPIPGGLPIEVTPWTTRDVVHAYDTNAVSPFLPIRVAQRVPEDLEVLIAENQMQYPGIDVEPVALRRYPHGTMAAHLLGYVKPLSEEELELDEVINADKSYASGDDIGKSGVELAYEEYLRGTPGERVIEVDADNRIVRTISYDPPIAGDDIMLAMDIRVQALLEQSLFEQAQEADAPGASGLVLDPRDGSVIAMASYPTFNPAEMSGRVSNERYDELTAEENGAPLNNKVISGQYLPGSTFKPVTALASLRAGVLTPEFSYNDTGEYVIPSCPDDPSCHFQNPNMTPLGTVNLASSLTVSSDTFYYRLGDQLWGGRDRIGEDALQAAARDFGFDSETNIDLPAASDGFVWTPEILADLYENNPEDFLTGDWFSGDTINMAIGQGYLGVTPLQLTNMYAAIGNGGVRHTPHVVRQILSPNPRTEEWEVVVDFAAEPPEPLGTVEMEPQWRSAIMQGLLGVPQDHLGGTAGGAFEGFDLANYPIAGKTGTAQKNDELDYGLFVGMGPVRGDAPPEYVVSAVFEAAGLFGGDIAAPTARRVFDGLANQGDPHLLPPVPNSILAEPVGSTPVEDIAVEDLPVPEVEE